MFIIYKFSHLLREPLASKLDEIYPLMGEHTKEKIRKPPYVKDVSSSVFILRFSAYPQTFSPPNFRRPDGRQFFKIHIVNNQEFLFCDPRLPQADFF